MLVINRMYKILLALVAFLPIAAYAHHPNDYKLPDSFAEGLLSGFGHPVIGPDHLAFIIGIGLLSYIVKQRLTIPLIFIASTIIGTVIHLNSIDIPQSEMLVASSLILLGLLLVTRQYKKPLIMMLALAGILHGYAYGESIVGAEATPLAAYFFGFAAIQFLLAYLVSFTSQWFHRAKPIVITQVLKVYGVVTICCGVVFLL